MDHKSLAEHLLGHDAMKQTSWSREALSMWLRDGCKCVYCERDMLDTYDVAYYAECRDHLLPRTEYEELGSEESNLVLACRTCNGLKGSWDPNVRSDAPLIYVKGSRVLTDEDRIQLVERAKAFIKQKRNDRQLLFETEQELIRGSLKARTAVAKA